MPNVDIIDGMAFGTGVDLGGQIFGDGVIRTQPEIVGGGQTTDIFLTLVDSQEDQDRALKLSTKRCIFTSFRSPLSSAPQ
jgi:hypothetical protein